MSPMLLSTLSAVFNLISFFLLGFGFLQAKKGNLENHKKLMTAALISSACFLVFYLTNRIVYGDTLYPYHDWTRPVYFIILIPHVILATVMTPFIIATAILGWLDKRRAHRRLAKVVFPVWLYVSLTGVMVFLFLRIQPMLRPPPPPPVATLPEPLLISPTLSVPERSTPPDAPAVPALPTP